LNISKQDIGKSIFVGSGNLNTGSLSLETVPNVDKEILYFIARFLIKDSASLLIIDAMNVFLDLISHVLFIVIPF
jgi:hypothetical protein